MACGVQISGGEKKAGGCSSGGCSSGGCSTGGCNKLNVFDWLGDMTFPAGYKQFDIVEVRFKGSRKEFYRNTNNLDFTLEDALIVELENGYDIGRVSMKGELVKLQLKKNALDPETDTFRKIIRVANEADLKRWQETKELEVPTMYKAREIAIELNLNMKLSDVEYQGDRKKATFFYTAEDRVDFRELIKKLAETFRVKIEMRQIGYRQEAGRLGGIGSCGRVLCCSTWLTDFKQVTTSAARYQNLSLNPLKLSGQCGRLKCCLNYELDVYMEAVKEFPTHDNLILETEAGTARVQKTDILKRVMWFAYSNLDSDWKALSLDKVNEIVELNKKGIKPVDLIENVVVRPSEKKLDFKDMVGEESITRLDRPKSKSSNFKRRKK